MPLEQVNADLIDVVGQPLPDVAKVAGAMASDRTQIAAFICQRGLDIFGSCAAAADPVECLVNLGEYLGDLTARSVTVGLTAAGSCSERSDRGDQDGHSCSESHYERIPRDWPL